MELHLAQYNIARLRHPLDHPVSVTYVALLDEVNAAADASPGFVWRHGIDSRDQTGSLYDDPLMLANASVWESLAHLRDYVYRGGVHKEVFRRRHEWFDGSGAVMWWVPAGTIPSIPECKARLEFLEQHGPTPFGFETGQRHEQLVIVERDAQDADVVSLSGGRASAERVHVAVLEGRAVGAAQHLDHHVVTWLATDVGSAWLEPALRCVATTA